MSTYQAITCIYHGLRNRLKEYNLSDVPAAVHRGKSPLRLIILA